MMKYIIRILNSGFVLACLLLTGCNATECRPELQNYLKVKIISIEKAEERIYSTVEYKNLTNNRIICHQHGKEAKSVGAAFLKNGENVLHNLMYPDFMIEPNQTLKYIYSWESAKEFETIYPATPIESFEVNKNVVFEITIPRITIDGKNIEFWTEEDSTISAKNMLIP